MSDEELDAKIAEGDKATLHTLQCAEEKFRLEPSS